MLAGLLRRFAAPAPPLPTGPRSVTRTHVGRIRAVNEDRVFACPTRGLWAVADGMGGHSAGDVAATIAITALQALADDPATLSEGTVRATLVEANAAIRAERRNPDKVSGATIVVAHIDAGIATILWAGDSRAYRYRDGILTPVTSDHSVVQQMIDAGTLDPARARTHPHAHVVTRALGVAETIAIDVVTVELLAGDRLLLCSDGLSGAVVEGMIAARLRYPAAAAADALIDAALAAGGYDNISLVLIEN